MLPEAYRVSIVLYPQLFKRFLIDHWLYFSSFLIKHLKISYPLSTVLTTSRIFWYIFHYSVWTIFCFPLWFHFWPIDYLEMCCLFPTIWYFTRYLIVNCFLIKYYCDQRIYSILFKSFYLNSFWITAQDLSWWIYYVH